MTNLKNTKKHSVSYSGFGGIDHTLGHSCKPIAEDIVNFRIRKDGSLEKRYGFRLLFDLGSTVRALHGVTENGKFILYALLGSGVYTIDCSTGKKLLIDSVETEEGKAIFFNYRGDLYLADSSQLYRLDGEKITKAVGYVPQMGKDWPNNVPSNIYEPRNILNKHAWLTYTVSELQSIYMHTKYPVESVEAVYSNGNLLNEGQYRIDDEFTTVNVSGAITGDKIEIHLTFKEGVTSLLSRLVSTQYSAIFGGTDNTRIFLCGGAAGSTVFVSEHVTNDRLEASQKHYPDSNVVYFPEGTEFSAGDGANAVQAITRHRDKLLIFTEGDVWMATASSDGRIRSSSVNSKIGCPSKGGAVTVGNETVSLGKRSVWLWSDDQSSQGNCKSVKLSEAIDDELVECGLQNCGIFYDRNENELWVYSRISDIAWIYNFGNGFWYKFKGIAAEYMLELDGQTAFLRSGKLFVFDKSQPYDADEYGTVSEIAASYVSSITDFGTENAKNLSSLVMRADLCGEPVTLTLEGDDTASKSFTVTGSYKHSVIKKRLFSGRFFSARFKLETAGLCRQSIHDLTLYAR